MYIVYKTNIKNHIFIEIDIFVMISVWMSDKLKIIYQTYTPNGSYCFRVNFCTTPAIAFAYDFITSKKVNNISFF